LEKQLNKLIEVIKVRSFNSDEILQRELLITKVTVSAEKRSEIMSIAEIMGAKIIDISLKTMTLQICDTSMHLERFEELIRPYGVLEVVRTGMVAIQKGTNSLRV
jgi:acetolactate synthase-1/3 small subunit